MSSSTRNYHAHGGNEWIVGGKLTFLPGAVVEGAEGPRRKAALRRGKRSDHRRSSPRGLQCAALRFQGGGHHGGRGC